MIDETAGIIRNIDQQYIQTRFSQYQQQVEAFINNQNPDTTVGEVLDTKKIQEENFPTLPASLPYEKLNQTNTFAAIQDSLRHKYKMAFMDQYGFEQYSKTFTLPELAGKTLALSFKPATQVDEDTLKSFIPDNIADVSQLPQSLPGGYLINLEAEIVVNNQNQNTGLVRKMGEELKLQQALYNPTYGWNSTDSTIITGEYHAIGVNGVGIGANQLQNLKVAAEAVQAKVKDCQDNQNCEPVKTLNKHQLTGLILQSGVLSWFALTQIQNQLMARQHRIIYQPLPSYGKFSSDAKVQYSWGIPRNIRFPGVVMDIDYHQFMAEQRKANKSNTVNFVKISGTQSSANEHLVAEQLFSTTENPVQGISAVKALTIAASQGQKIYILTQANAAQLANIQIDTEVRTEIQNALYANK